MNVIEKLRHLTGLPDDKVVVLSRTEAAQILARLQAAEAIIEYADQMSDAFPFSDRDLPDCVQELNQAIHNWRAAGKGE